MTKGDYLRMDLEKYGQDLEKLRARLDASFGDPSAFNMPLQLMFNDVLHCEMDDALLTKLWMSVRMAVPGLVMTAMSGLTIPGTFLVPGGDGPGASEAERALEALSVIYYEFDQTIILPVYVTANIERGNVNADIPRPYWSEKWGNAGLVYQARLKRLWDEAMARAVAV